MSSHTRREFMSTTGMALAARLTSRMADATQNGGVTPRIRKNVMSAAAKSDLASLSKGVGEMRKLATTAASDPRGWILQSFIHGDCSHFSKCQHGNWFFAPWHRSYLYYFEELIQFFSGDKTFALPYWDWSRSSGVPSTFYGSANSLDDITSISSSCSGAPTAGRGRSATEAFSASDLSTYVGLGVVNDIQNNPDFATYAGDVEGTGQLEATPHNFIHRWVGGLKGSNMVQFYSPLDPVFWLHHCNIDRLYSNWLARPNHFPPSDPKWRTKSFKDFVDSSGKAVGDAFKCGDTVDSTVMGYVYDDSIDVRMMVMSRPKAQALVTVGSLTSSKPMVRGGVLTFTTDAPVTPNFRMSMGATALGATEYVSRLVISGVRIPAHQNTAVDVFIGSDVTANTPRSAAGYVGSFTFFDGPGMNVERQHAGSHQILLNANHALRRVYGDTGFPANSKLSVSIVTRPLYTGVKEFATVEDVQPDQVRLEIARFGS